MVYKGPEQPDVGPAAAHCASRGTGRAFVNMVIDQSYYK